MTTSDADPAHRELLEQQAFLRRLARRLVSDEHGAADLVQETSVTALECMPRQIVSMRSWLARVLRNRAAKTARGELRRVSHERDASQPAVPQTPEEIAQHLAVQRRVLAAVEALSEPYKSTIYLRYYVDLAPSAIAERTGVPVATVKTRLARGLERLRTELDAEHGGDRNAWALCLAGSFGLGRDMAIGTSVAAGGAAMGATMLGTKWIAAALFVSLAWWIGSSVMERPVEPVAPVAIGPAAPVVAREPSAPLSLPENASARSLMAAQPQQEPEAARAAWLLHVTLNGLTDGVGDAVSLQIDYQGSIAPASKTFTATAAPRMEVDVSSIFEKQREPPARLGIRFDHPRYLPATRGVNVPLPATETGMEVTLDLARASGIVTGTVLPPVGVEARRVHVDLFAMMAEKPRPERWPVDTTHVDPGGGYRLRASAAAAHVLVAWVENEPDEYDARHFPAMFRPETRSVVLVENKCELAPIGFDRGAPIRGRVEFPEGGTFEGEPEVEVRIIPQGVSYLPMNGMAWRDGAFLVSEMSTQWDGEGRFAIEGLTEGIYGLRVFGAPPAPHQTRVPALRLDLNAEPTIQVAAPEPNLVLSIVRPRHSFLVTGAGVPIEGALFEGVYRGLYESNGRQGTWTNADGRADVVLDKGKPLELHVTHPGYLPRKLELSAAELEGDGVIEIELQEDTPPATVRILAGEADWPDGVAFDFVWYDMRVLGETRAAIEKQRIPIAMSSSRSLRLGQVPDASVRLEMKIGADWCEIDGIPSGSYFLRIAATAINPDTPCFYLPLDFDLELPPDAYRTLTWKPEIGGELRLDFRGSASDARAALLDARGETYPATFLQQGPGLHELATGPRPLLTGPSLVRPALPAGTYTLRVEKPDGRHDVPLTIEAGRVTRLEVDLDKL